MAYDAARGQVVLFGGFNRSTIFRDTWTWDGTDWTKHTPAHSPSARYYSAMAYDSGRGQVVLSGGFDRQHHLRRYLDLGRRRLDQALAGTFASPAVRSGDGLRLRPWASRALRRVTDVTFLRRHLDLGRRGLDASAPHPTRPCLEGSMGLQTMPRADQVAIIGGLGLGYLGDTWTWNGADWTKRSPAHSPSRRSGAAMAYDTARDQIVLFGGYHVGRLLRRHLDLSVEVKAWGFAAGESVELTFLDSVQGRIVLRKVRADTSGAFTTQVKDPAQRNSRRQRVKATGLTSGQIAVRRFTVT